MTICQSGVFLTFMSGFLRTFALEFKGSTPSREFVKVSPRVGAESWHPLSFFLQTLNT